MAIIKYSDGVITKTVKPNEEVSAEYLEKKMEKAANPDEEWIEKEASDDSDKPPWAE